MVLDLYVYNMFLLTSNFIVASSVSCTLTTSTSSQALSLFLALSKYPLNIWRIDLTGPGVCIPKLGLGHRRWDQETGMAYIFLFGV